VNPAAHLILTVSPVPLGSTFAPGLDHAIANTESKSILRAVAGELVRKDDHVHYFHSYELVMHASRGEVFLDDGRHVRPEYVAGIMQDFEKAFVRQLATPAPAPRRAGPHFIDLSTPAACGANLPVGQAPPA
jgi:GSCFA family